MPSLPLQLLLPVVILGLSACGRGAEQPSGLQRLDGNQDGFVDRGEFAKSEIGQRNPGLFDQLDTNNDGKLSHEESLRYGTQDPRPLHPSEADRQEKAANPGEADEPAQELAAGSGRVSQPAPPVPAPVPSDSSLALKPGARLILRFPELPQTLHAMQSGKEATPQLYIALPENYTSTRKFPLFVFLYGGHGGAGAGPGRGQEMMENRDCIFVNLPLFKKNIDPNGPFRGMMITTEQDGEVICHAYGAMLKKIYETVPNIDTGHNIIGGMSNGAHSIVAIFEHGDPYLMGLFQNLILVEGGFFSIKTFARYQGKGILYLYGDYVGQDDWLGSKMRAELPQIIKNFADAADANDLQATGLVMPNTGHDMPTRFNSDVKAWVVKQLAE